MYLKSIELYGFKSFAERTVIEFNDSLTCIVGPNGSGKSNITDAIQWVLGEQSYLTLRGSSMGDVIFKGTSHRRPLGMAEVIATFDNSDGTLDTPYTTVEIKRKLYKNGDSEYYINNGSCRLKDIREMFMDTGIGRDGYSIIGQGRIADILNSKPQERMSIFEEAAGISRYKSEKTEVERKLISTDDDMIRLSDILIEIRQQESRLKTQVKSALKYLEIYKDLKELDLKISSDDYNTYSKELESAISKLEELNKEKEKLDNYVITLETEYNELSSSAAELDNNINQLQALNVDNIKKEQEKKSSIQLADERITVAESTLTDLKAQIDVYKTTIKKVARTIEEKKEQLKEDLAIVRESKSELKDKTQRATDIKSELDILNTSKENTQEKLSQADLELSRLEVRLESAQVLQTDKSLEKDLDDKIENIRSTITDQKEGFNTLKDRENAILDSINVIDQKINDHREEIEKFSNTLTEIDRSYISTNRSLKGMEAKLDSLINLEDNYDGYNRSIQSFFRYYENNDVNIPGLVDTVANLIRVSPKYEKAISVALGAASQNLVVETFDDAKYIIDLLRRENLGRITFLPMDSIRTYNRSVKTVDGMLGVGSELVDYNEKYSKVIDHLLSGTLVAETLECAREISRSNGSMRVVTLDGDIIYPGGSVTGGQSNFRGNIFSRKNEIDKLKTEIDESKITTKTLERNYRDILADRREKVDELTELESKKTDIEKQKAALEQEKYRLDHDINSAVLSEKDLLNEKSELLSKIDTSNKDIKDLNNSIEKIEMDRKIYTDQLSELNTKINYLSDAVTRLDKEVSVKNIELTKLSTKSEYLKDDIEGSISEQSDLYNQVEETDKKIAQLSTEIQENSEKKETLENKLSALSEIIKNNRSEYLEKIKTLETLRTKEKSTNKDLNRVRVESLDLEKSIFKYTGKVEKLTDNIKDLKDRIGGEYYLSLIEKESTYIDDELLKADRKALKTLKTKLKRLGNVNLDAIKEYDEVSQRLEFEEEQFKDLEDTKKQLKDLLSDIESVMAEKFSENFKTINDSFRRIFSYMFNGGSAELVTVGSGELDEMGVDIQVQLPGKRKQPLNALSGGEKSMTAVSLIFSFLETNPSPFCLLDEVDAALDEGNIGRFISYLKTMSDIQFALITHRKSTMEAADNIYGITMEEPGVSKVLHLEFDEDYERITNV